VPSGPVMVPVQCRRSPLWGKALTPGVGEVMSVISSPWRLEGWENDVSLVVLSPFCSSSETGGRWAGGLNVIGWLARWHGLTA